MNKIIDGIHVKTYGEVTNQSIIFIHGFPFDHTLFKNVINEFKDEYYCISYDIRGFGDSEFNTGQYTMESYVEDLENVISRLKLYKPIICGFSMGGYIALRINEKLGGNYKALILANTITSNDNDEAKLKRAAAISNIDAKGIEPFIDKFLSVAFSENFSKKEPLKLEKIKDKIMRLNPIGIKGGILAMVSRTDTTRSLKKIDIPVLLISGENDQIISPDIMEQMANKIKNSTFVCLSDSGHVSMLEKPDEFNSAMRRFLETV
ncbi:MAG: alpha/beta hydrolase [Sulfurimonas sp.]|jgi:3-oxoadipate enol-lactonase|nr:alpha/beta hydrolase [Sulfurimonas sp.]